jgi:cation-transporting ATPase 13A1
MQEELKVAITELSQRGEYGKMWQLMKDQAVKTRDATARENARFAALHGQAWDPKKDGAGAGAAGGLAGMLESLEASAADGSGGMGGLPIVRPGDASVAAPFTSRVPSVRAVVDLIRQGRCTLLSALMQQQIMMLESIIAAYTLSALSLHNARSSERQMMASSWLIMTAAISFSYAAPLDKMAKLRPLRSLFHPAIFVSILGQAAIHITCMTLAVEWATTAMGPEALKEVTEFFRKAKAREITSASLCEEDDYMCQFRAMWEAPFMPNLLNTTVFLVETGMTISVFFANYKGRPWMKGMMDNHPLFLSVFACIGACVVAAWELVPQLNELIQLTPFPSDEYRMRVVMLVLAAILGTFAWDRLCTAVFAPEIFGAMVAEARKTTIADIAPVFTTLFKVVGVVLVLGSGNLLLMGLAFWWWRNSGATAAAAAAGAAPVAAVTGPAAR